MEIGPSHKGKETGEASLLLERVREREVEELTD